VRGELCAGGKAQSPQTRYTSINADLTPSQDSLWDSARGGNLASLEPVTLRATGYMKGPSGSFVRLFTESCSVK
jgi:hypothetical protein